MTIYDYQGSASLFNQYTNDMLAKKHRKIVATIPLLLFGENANFKYNLLC